MTEHSNDNLLNNINTSETWIDVETLAKLKDITKRAVRLSLNQNKYEYKTENIRGGKTYKIRLSTIEEQYQIKYINEYYNDFKTVDNEIIELEKEKRIIILYCKLYNVCCYTKRYCFFCFY